MTLPEFGGKGVPFGRVRVTLETYRKGALSYHASHSGKSKLLIVGATDKPTLVIPRFL